MQTPESAKMRLFAGGLRPEDRAVGSPLGIGLLSKMRTVSKGIGWPQASPKDADFVTKDMMCQALIGGQETLVEPIGVGIHRPYRVEFLDGMDSGPVTTRRAALKTIYCQYENKRYCQAVDLDVTGPEREILSFNLDRMFGFDLVPPTIGREIEKIGFGSVQAWVDCPTAWQWIERGYDYREDKTNPWLHRLAAFDFIRGEIDRHCLAEGTLVKTWGGHVPIERVRPGDLVLTHEGRWRPVVSVFAKRYSGRMLEIRARRTSERLILTPEHKLPVVHRLGRVAVDSRNGLEYVKSRGVAEVSEVEIVHAGEIRRGDVLLYPVRKERDRDVVPLPARLRKIPDRPLPSLVPVDGILMALAGWYLAEGSIIRRAVKGRKYITGVSFALSEKETEYAQEIANLASVYGLPTKVRPPREGGISVCVYNADLGRLLLDLCGEHSDGKRLKDWMVDLPAEKLRPLIEAYFKGDGVRDGKHRRPKTSSFEMAQQIRDIVLRLGHAPRMAYCKGGRKTKIGERDVVQGPMWEVGWCPDGLDRGASIKVDGFLALPVRGVKEFFYEGVVYDLEVAEDHTFCTPTVVVHNSNNWIMDEEHRVYAIDNGYSVVKGDDRTWFRSSAGKHLVGTPIHPAVMVEIQAIDENAAFDLVSRGRFKNGEADGVAKRIMELKGLTEWRKLGNLW